MENEERIKKISNMNVCLFTICKMYTHVFKSCK